jgi:hypothetical protein
MADITELRPSPKTGEGPSANALRQRRFRKQRKALRRNAHVTAEKAKSPPVVTPEPGAVAPAGAVTVRRNAAIGVTTYVAAALLGAVGISLSAIGMVETASYFPAQNAYFRVERCVSQDRKAPPV